jgi:hypothetical protein
MVKKNTEKLIVEGFVKMYREDFYVLIYSDDISAKFSSKRKDGKIPRPSNAFFQFKAYVLQYAIDNKLELDHNGGVIILSSSQAYLSKVASALWHPLDKGLKEKFKSFAEQAKKLLEIEYPGYKYKPTRHRAAFKAADKKKTRSKNKRERIPPQIDFDFNIQAQDTVLNYSPEYPNDVNNQYQLQPFFDCSPSTEYISSPSISNASVDDTFPFVNYPSIYPTIDFNLDYESLDYNHDFSNLNLGNDLFVFWE